MFNYLSWKQDMAICSHIIILLLLSNVVPVQQTVVRANEVCAAAHTGVPWRPYATLRKSSGNESAPSGQGRGCGWEIPNRAVFIQLLFWIRDTKFSRQKLRCSVPVTPVQHRSTAPPGNAHLLQEHNHISLLGRKGKRNCLSWSQTAGGMQCQDSQAPVWEVQRLKTVLSHSHAQWLNTALFTPLPPPKDTCLQGENSGITCNFCSHIWNTRWCSESQSRL